MDSGNYKPMSKRQGKWKQHIDTTLNLDRKQKPNPYTKIG